MTFDQVPTLAGFRIIVALMLSVRFRRDHGTDTSLSRFFREPICVKRPVSRERAGWNIADQRSNALHIVCLPGQQQEANKVARRIHKRDNPGRQAAARAPNGMMPCPPFAPVAFW